ncbi:MAG: hypothetical protein A2826_00540 [Candidatus Doudnabacteria bacterium RIFCSPHIGHO2_01_FULL_43_23]|uniref:Carotenoid oxygenase n=1 Tax=Candidatus Doudnabacteria bacterium RIFCSPHIGHO2_01_FULL_43_23 TaxID=1817822 RepID=A0A1F5NV31_9BACT|nr:MAG: hypothetical protein A2826_00540 [Candidatus Doudnabacteria bacterium RIFCSPHIGHO2_01_FULL_43_23]
MKYKAVIFDFDGTIADTKPYTLRFINELADQHNFRKIPETEIERYQSMTFREAMRAVGMPMWKLPSVAIAARKKFAKLLTKVEPVQGMKETISKLKKAGLRLGVVSSNSRGNIMKFFGRNNIPAFDYIGAEKRIFGKHYSIRQIMRKLQVKKDQSVYIGDEMRDIEAARRAGIDVIAVSWGLNSRKALKSTKPDYLVDKPMEIIKIIESK